MKEEAWWLKNNLFKNYYMEEKKSNSVETAGVTDTCQRDDK